MLPNIRPSSPVRVLWRQLLPERGFGSFSSLTVGRSRWLEEVSRPDVNIQRAQQSCSGYASSTPVYYTTFVLICWYAATVFRKWTFPFHRVMQAVIDSFDILSDWLSGFVYSRSRNVYVIRCVYPTLLTSTTSSGCVCGREREKILSSPNLLPVVVFFRGIRDSLFSGPAFCESDPYLFFTFRQPSMESGIHSRQMCGLGKVHCASRVSNRRALIPWLSTSPHKVHVWTNTNIELFL